MVNIVFMDDVPHVLAVLPLTVAGLSRGQVISPVRASQVLAAGAPLLRSINSKEEGLRMVGRGPALMNRGDQISTR